MQKFRIAFIVNVFPSVSETFILNQIVDLIDRGHEVDIFAQRQDFNATHQKINEYGLMDRVSYAEAMPANKFKRALRAGNILMASGKAFWPLVKSLNYFKHGRRAFKMQAFFEYGGFIEKPPYDIIHAHFGPNGCKAVQMKMDGLFARTKLVTTFHGYDISADRMSLHRQNYKNLFREGDLFTVNSDYTRKLLLQAGCPEEKIVKLPVGINTSFYRRNYKVRKNERDVIKIVFCGRLLPLKGPDNVVKISKYLTEVAGIGNFKAYLIGDGQMEETVKALVEEYRLVDYVEMVGIKGQEEIIDMLSDMDIFLHPARKDPRSGKAETQGLVIQEAQALELPVVVGDVGGIPEGLIAGKTGFLAKEDDIADFANKILLLMRDPELRQSMGKNGRTFVEANFDIRVLGNRLIQLYNKLLASS